MPVKQNKGNTYTYKDSWYYTPEVRLLKTRLNRVRKNFRKRQTEINRLTLQNVVRDVTERLAQIRENKWYEWCEQLSRLTKIRDTWAWLKTATGRTKSNKTATHPNPQQEADRLATSFAQRSNSENLPLETRNTQQQLLQQRLNTINAACNSPDDTDALYTLEELRKTYKISKDTAPGADKITYTMIRNMGIEGEKMTLKLINRTHTERIRPENWNKQDTQPIPKHNEPNTYRPISLLSCIEKTAERMVLNRPNYKIGQLH